MLTASAASKDGSTLWSAHVISDGCQCLCCETPRDPSSTPRLSTTMSSSKMMLLPAKKKRRSPGILLGFFFLSLCFIFCNWHDSGRPHVISSWTDWDAHLLKTYYIFHFLDPCVKLGVSPRILYCVVDTGYGLGRSLGDCRPALPNGKKYQMVKKKLRAMIGGQ